MKSELHEPLQEQMKMNSGQPSLVERRMRFMPCTVKPSDSVAHARALLGDGGLRHLPVMSNDRLVGIVSVQDLKSSMSSRKHRALAKLMEVHPDRVKINLVMTTNVRTVTPSDNLAYAAQLLSRKHIGALPVVEHGRLVGIITVSDLVDILATSETTKSDRIRQGLAHSAN
jgi:CBS domain-containing protein